ncbi:MAG: type II secretion system F family protein [Planctomycetota bacterium]
MPPETAAAVAEAPAWFEYKARRGDGLEVRGRASADGELDLDRMLARDGLTLVSARPSRSARKAGVLRLRHRELVALTTQFATMMEAGIPVLRALQHLGEHSRSHRVRSAVESMLHRIEGGASLSETLVAHPAIFDETYIAMVKGAEMSATLPEALRRQGRYLEWVHEVRATVRQALIYPAALGLAVVGLVIILVTFLIPRLVALFPGGHDDLPEQTKVVLGISSFFRDHGIVLVSLVIVVAAGFPALLRARRSRLFLSRALLGIPRLGELVRMLAVARFATVASALQRSGCDIVRTLEIASDACGSTFLRERFHAVRAAVQGWNSISEGMKQAGGIDPYLEQLTAVGETSGRVSECWESIAESYGAEIPRAVKWALGLIEPCVLIVGGIVVAYLLVAAVLPIFKIYETLG